MRATTQTLYPIGLCSIGLALAAAAALGCGSSSGSDPADGGSGPDSDPSELIPQERSCGTQFSFTATGPVESVAVAGQWDWQSRTPLTDPDGDGNYGATLELLPGLHAYKLIVTEPGAGEQWILDPANPYRVYDGGVENSGARVADCTEPLLELQSFEQSGDTATASLQFHRGNGGPNPGAITASLIRDFSATSVDVEREGGAVRLSTAGLAPGKYTLRIEATDQNGRAAAPVLLPFWIESQRFEWNDTPIYMVMLDRFRDGNPANSPGATFGVDPGAEFLGGDLAGVTEAIEDGSFDALGIKALWLSPFTENTTRYHHEEGGHGVSAFHGYWPVRAREIDPRFGTSQELEALVSAAHARGIRVLMDFVINHVHEDHEYFAAHPEWFRTGCKCGTPGCDWTDQRLECLFHEFMPDINWQVTDAGEQFIADALWWLERYDLDGFRVDAVKHVEDLAITNLSTRIGETFERAGTDYFLLGETAMGWAGHDVAANHEEYQTISRYIGEHGLSGQFDFVLYHASAYRVWANDEFGMPHVDFWTRASLEQYPQQAIMTPFLGSHDSERFVSLADLGSGNPLVHHKWADQGLPSQPGDAEPYERARVAFTWLLTVPGAPLLYYGDEYGEFGGADPDNRHMWRPPSERSDDERNLFDWITTVGAARAQSLALRRGAYTPLTVTEPFLSYARHTASDLAIVALNHSAQPVTETIALPPSMPPAGTLSDRLDPSRAAVDASTGSFTITLAPRSAAILTPDGP